MWIAIFNNWNQLFESFNPAINIEGVGDIAIYLPPANQTDQIVIYPNGTVLFANGTLFTGDIVIQRATLSRFGGSINEYDNNKKFSLYVSLGSRDEDAEITMFLDMHPRIPQH